MDAFDATTGAHLWTAILPGQYSFSSPPIASNGVVYTSGAGSGGTLYAVDETDGAVLATQPVENGDNSSPALSDHGVFVQYACDQTYAFAQQTLDPLWHYSTDCEGGGGSTPVYADGDIFTQDYFGNLILSAATGNLIRSWAPAANNSPPPPAVDSNTLFFVNQGALVAENLAGGTQKWSFPSGGQLEPQPIVISTPNGEFVIIDSSAGNLYAVDAATGQLAWSGSLGTTIPDFPRLAAGQGLLVAPAGNVLTAYTGTSTCSPSAPSTISSSFRPRVIGSRGRSQRSLPASARFFSGLHEGSRTARSPPFSISRRERSANTSTTCTTNSGCNRAGAVGHAFSIETEPFADQSADSL